MYTKEVNIKESLKSDCKSCFGLCCVALFFSKSEGFPVDKIAGKPCINLNDDFKCKVHKDLNIKGLKGCLAYDCFGAGQKVSQVTYSGESWRDNPHTSKEMYEVFVIVRQLHEMLWYLTEAISLQSDLEIKKNVQSLIQKTEEFTKSNSQAILKIDLISHRFEVNKFLLETKKSIRNKVKKKNSNHLKAKNKFSLMGKDLRKTELIGEDLSGSFLIAANLSGVDLSFTDLIGADLRDTNIRGADLSNSIYLTQAQINSAKGDYNTRLPKSLIRPSHWAK